MKPLLPLVPRLLLSSISAASATVCLIQPCPLIPRLLLRPLLPLPPPPGQPPGRGPPVQGVAGLGAEVRGPVPPPGPGPGTGGISAEC